MYIKLCYSVRIYVIINICFYDILNIIKFERLFIYDIVVLVGVILNVN